MRTKPWDDLEREGYELVRFWERPQVAAFYNPKTKEYRFVCGDTVVGEKFRNAPKGKSQLERRLAGLLKRVYGIESRKRYSPDEVASKLKMGEPKRRL